jgi:hypothetical protein
LVGRLAGLTRLLKTLEQCRLGRPRGSVQGSCLEFVRGFGLLKIRVDFLLVRQIERNRAVDFLERLERKRPLHRLGGRTALEGVNDGIQRNPRSRNPVSAVPLFDVGFFHIHPRILAVELIAHTDLIVPLIPCG